MYYILVYELRINFVQSIGIRCCRKIFVSIVTKMNSICYLYHLYITITDYLRAAYIQCRSSRGQSTSSFNITCVVLQSNISQQLF